MIETRNRGREPDILDRITGVDANVIAAARLLLVSAGGVIPSQRPQGPQDGIAGMVEARQTPAIIHRETLEEQEWRRQTDGFISRGFHEALKYSNAEAYRLTFPQFDPTLRSDDYGRFLVVEPRISLPKLHQLAGITEFTYIPSITNTIRIPKKPYVVCLQSGPVELVVGTFDQAMAKIPQNGIATTLIEVDMAYLRYPELFQPWIDAGSSRCGAASVPYLGVFGGGLGVDAAWIDLPDRYWRLLSRGKKLGT